jgi:hypothetical protein
MSRTISLLIAAAVLTACAADATPPVAPPLADVVATTNRDPACVQSSRLIGRISLTTGDGPTEWWGLTRLGLLAAGIEPSAFKSTIEGFFSRPFATLDEAVAYLVARVAPLDENVNGFVCAYELRGKKTGRGDPHYTDYVFSVVDDAH